MKDHLLTVVMYHYIRDLRDRAFPHLKGFSIPDFMKQVDRLCLTHHILGLEELEQYLDGRLNLKKPGCVLTFDDGLRDHYDTVLPVLVRKGIPGFFFLITSLIEEKRVAPVHKIHSLIGLLGEDEFEDKFLHEYEHQIAEIEIEKIVPTHVAEKTYRWDKMKTKKFKYLLNFILQASERDIIVNGLFEQYCGPESTFSKSLYVSWDETREMHKAGMVLGGHSHQHKALSTLSKEELTKDIDNCSSLLNRNIDDLSKTFSYPYGKHDTFNDETIETLKDFGFSFAFTTEVGRNSKRQNKFLIKRLDPKDV